jgi:glycosyltransferase involved in cell wall biosynthesis
VDAPGLVLLTRAPDRGRGAKVLRRARSARVAAQRARHGEFGPRGPQAVATSLVRGLTELGVPFVVDPPRLDGARTIGVLSDLEALRAGISWRREGSGRRLVVGPNLVVLPSDEPELMAAPEIDAIAVPSRWVRELYEADTPGLQGRIAVWPAGVDPARWRPPIPAEPRGRRALMYVKALNGDEMALEAAVEAAGSALAAAGFRTTRLSYGGITPRAYRRALAAADVLVFFSPSESQCLAQVEAWATDVPTLVWARGRLEYRGRVYSSSSAPYLSSATGAAFADGDELAALLVGWDELAAGFAPRRWVLENMTDAISARIYRDLTTSG